jgi:hypothetical protein
MFTGHGTGGAQAVAFDAQGNLFIGISVLGPSFEIGGTTLAVQGYADVALVKLSPSLDLLWMRSIVGPDLQNAVGVATDPQGRVVIVGDTYGDIDFGAGVVPSLGPSRYVAVYSPDSDLEWARVDSGVPHAHVAMLSQGDVVVGGGFQSNLSFSDGPSWSHGLDFDAFLARYDGATGDLVWAELIGTPGQEYLFSLATTPDDAILVVAEAEDDGVIDFGQGPINTDDAQIVVARLSSFGEQEWANALGGDSSELNIAAGPDGDVYVAGGLYGVADWGGGPLGYADDEQILLARFAATGEHVFSRTLGSHSYAEEAAEGVGVDASGNVVIAGRAEHQGSTVVDLGGGPRTTVTDDALFVAKYDDTGAHLWSETFGADHFGDWFRNVAAAPDGRSAVVGDNVTGLDLGNGSLLEAGIFGAVFAP